MVTNDDALTAVCRGPDGILAAIKGKTLVEMSTVGTAHVQALATKTQARPAASCSTHRCSAVRFRFSRVNC